MINGTSKTALRSQGLGAIAFRSSPEPGEAHSIALTRTFESLGVAAITLNRLGEVIDANRRAMLLQGPEFRVARGRISISNRHVSARLETAFDAILDVVNGIRACGPLPVPREIGRPLVLRAIGLDNPSAVAQILLLIKDPDAWEPIMPEHLVRLFGLTMAEANLASLLAFGTNLFDAAELLKITRETARSRLKSIFAKTDTNKQGGLIALLTRIAHPF